MKRNIAIFIATFLISAFLIAAVFAALFITYGGTNLADCLQRSLGGYTEKIVSAPTLAERLDRQTSDRIVRSADILSLFLPFGKRVALKGMLCGLFLLKF